MNYWITTDTHLGHDALIEYCGRPDNFTDKILRSHSRVPADDILIHLGDICIGSDSFWHAHMRDLWKCQKWLIKGNHDKRSNTWYMNNGWNFVGDAIILNIHGARLLLSHIPQKKNKLCDLNLHGHFHNVNHRRHETDLKAIKHPKHILIKLEHEYMPIKITPKQVGKWWAEYHKQQAAYKLKKGE